MDDSQSPAPHFNSDALQRAIEDLPDRIADAVREAMQPQKDPNIPGTQISEKEASNILGSSNVEDSLRSIVDKMDQIIARIDSLALSAGDGGL